MKISCIQEIESIANYYRVISSQRDSPILCLLQLEAGWVQLALVYARFRFYRNTHLEIPIHGSLEEF